jgi:hypothetical protein
MEAADEILLCKGDGGHISLVAVTTANPGGAYQRTIPYQRTILMNSLW